MSWKHRNHRWAARSEGWPGREEMSMRRRVSRGRRMRWRWMVGVLAAVWVAGLPPFPVPRASAAGPTIGVVDFYAIPSMPFLGISPERFTAGVLSEMLTRAGADRVAVLPRSEVLQAEQAIGWRNDDVLHFARMGELAQRLHADRLVVGWIRDLRVGGDFHVFFPFPSSEIISGYAVLQVQVFDAPQGRLVMSREFTGDSTGVVRTFVAQEALHRALIPAVAPALEVLTGPQP